ncbi:unnamed protein product [Arctogadus glacialis]
MSSTREHEKRTPTSEMTTALDPGSSMREDGPKTSRGRDLRLKRRRTRTLSPPRKKSYTHPPLTSGSTEPTPTRAAQTVVEA